MAKVLGPIAALLLSVSLLLMGNGLQGTLLPVRGGIEGFSPMSIGVLGSSYFLGFAAGCLWAPNLIERAGHVRAFAAVVAVASTVVLAHAMILDPIVWWLLRAVTGACFAALYMIIESWLNEKSTNEDRGLVFSLYTIINLTVITLGQLMLMLDEPTDFPLFSVASILISLSAVPLVLTKAPAPAPIEAVRVDFRRLYASSPAGLIGSLVVGLTNGSFWALAPLFVQSSGADVDQVALFMSVGVLGGAIGQWPLGSLSDRVDRRRVLQIASGGAAFAGVAVAAAAQLAPPLLLGAGFAYGFFAFPLYAISVAHTNDYVAPEGYVEAASGLLLAYALGAVVGPFVASALIAATAASILFVFTAAVHLSMLLYVAHRISQRAPAEEEDRSRFAEALLVSATTSSIDPLRDVPEGGGGESPSAN